MRCAYCGSTNGPFERDHVVPRTRGGPDEPINIVVACRDCNNAKGDRLPSEWLTHVPPEVAAIEQRVSAVVAKSTRGNRRGVPMIGRPPNVRCDACKRHLFPSLDDMHVCLWYRWPEENDQGPTEVLAFEVLCSGYDGCLIRKNKYMEAKYGLAAHLSDLPVEGYFGRWAWLHLATYLKDHRWTRAQLHKLVALMRQLSKVTPDEEPPTERCEDDDPTMVDD